MIDPNAAIEQLKDDAASMQSDSAVCRALWGGTLGMRAAGKTYLPQWPQEQDKAWIARKSSTTLFPAFRKAVETMVGRPFGSPIGVGKDVPSRVEATLDNIDLAGRDLDTFARDVLEAALRDGMTWIVVDYPVIAEGATVADERSMGAQPYWIHLPLENIIAWKSEMQNGKPVIVHLRYWEVDEEPDGPWATTQVKRIRVWEPGHTELWQKIKNEAGDAMWTMVEEANPQVAGKPVPVPVVAVYGSRKGFWCADPPLQDLAWLNVQHWQSGSDQRHVLHVARVPILGADEDSRGADQGPVTLGPDGIITGFKNLRYIEHTGAAIAAGRQDLVDLEEQMRRVAGELLSRQAGDKTATEATMEASESGSWLRRIVLNFQDALESCLDLSAMWLNLPDGGTLSLSTDWDDEILAADIITALTQARQAGAISQETYSWQMKQGGIIPPERSVEQEMDALEAEGPKPMPKGPAPPAPGAPAPPQGPPKPA